MSKIYDNFFRPSLCLPQDYFFLYDLYILILSTFYDFLFTPGLVFCPSENLKFACELTHFDSFCFFLYFLFGHLLKLISAAWSCSGLTIIDHSSNLTAVRSSVHLSQSQILNLISIQFNLMIMTINDMIGTCTRSAEGNN